jgi:1-acyl-sn-glycerol-3-phosphate acyltransferase
MRWIAKEELFRLPILGWMMRFGGDIPLRRGERASVEEMLREAKHTLAHGMSIMMFPEGTRSQTGKLGAFKDGAFQLAIDAQVPILPLALAGTRACRPKGSLWFGEARATVKILAPIETVGMTAADVPALRERARTQISDALPALRRSVGSADAEPEPEPKAIAGAARVPSPPPF